VHHVIGEKQSLLNVAVILRDCGRKTKPAESVNRLVKKAKVDKSLAIARQEAIAIVRGRHEDHIRIRADRLKLAQTIPDRAIALLIWHVDLERGKQTQWAQDLDSVIKLLAGCRWPQKGFDEADAVNFPWHRRKKAIDAQAGLEPATLRFTG
jgi:hypothetical protein